MGVHVLNRNLNQTHMQCVCRLPCQQGRGSFSSTPEFIKPEMRKTINPTSLNSVNPGTSVGLNRLSDRDSQFNQVWKIKPSREALTQLNLTVSDVTG